MNSENNISIPVILYGILFIIAVHFFSLSIERIIGGMDFLPLYFDEQPYARLIFLFFEIICVARCMRRIAVISLLRRRALYKMMILSISSLLFWLMLYAFDIQYSLMICGNSTQEELRNLSSSINRSEEISKIIEIIVISLFIIIYTMIRISEMPKEIKEIKEKED